MCEQELTFAYTSDRPELPAIAKQVLCPIGCRGLHDLHIVRHLTDLRDLDLSQTDISDSGLFHIAAMTQLTRLSLRDTAVTAVAFRALASLGSLQSLDVSHTSIHDRIQHNLGAPGSPPNLCEPWQSMQTCLSTLR